MPDPREALAPLAVIDRLEVGPVRLEPRRLRMPYTVTQRGEEARTELVYKWEEPVFDPQEVESRNLASLIGVQVALNYGLFCRELVLSGTFDRHDRRFLEEMARNTAREIFVNKLLMPNPFLLEPVRSLSAVRPRDFLRAELRFEGEDMASTGGPRKTAAWTTDRQGHAVLSSGGKDSLLSYGLLAELGRETHPIFLNESGRHWYTALNAHRHFKANVPHTARVWTSADRVFAWMLRRIPFIRPDFARLRSDEYPLRLWTVAVFLFGALPLLRQRGLGRLIIGDEHDTSVRLNFQGIPHYGGLYDQSRFFDNALSRFFARKGFNVSQLSLLRPLSELLIQKTLVERYPELQRHQVSCHAAHLEDDRVRPCGRCEKCRRIVGMLTALGADPRACGYTEDQIESALKTLSTLGVHQEHTGAEHLFALLAEQGHISARASRSAGLRPRPEVMKLRFHPERSPLDTIPPDLRGPLYTILLEHADGAVRRSGRLWVDFDPLSEESLSVPYRFEAPRSPEPASHGGDTRVRWSELSWPEARARLAEVDVALLPVGSIEQHGPHLPLDVDAFDAEKLCLEVAAGCSAPRPLVLPLLSYGVSYLHDDFAGTVSISPETLAQLAYEIGLSVARQGITKLVIVNGHGGNGPALNFAAQKINRDARIFTCVDTGETSDAEIDRLATTPNDVHAGEIETSTTLHYRPHLVHLDQARPSVPRFSSEYLEFSSKKGVSWYVRTARISQDGVMGDPTKASAELGEKIWHIMIRNLVELVEDLKGMTLDEIYQRRY